jgi:hypothetical protein
MLKLEVRSQRAMSFSPASLPKYSVIRLPYRFSGTSYSDPKRFVVLGHKAGHAICIKATSRMDFYRNNPEKLAGCVLYGAGEVSQFGEETVIQPDNQFPIPHAELQDLYDKGGLDLLGTLSMDFEAKLKTAIENSTTLNERELARLLSFLGSG